MRTEDTYHDSDQLELELGDKRLLIPWGGRSPRVLTAGYKLIILKRERQKKHERFVLGVQLEIWPGTIERAIAPSGAIAPTLLPLPELTFKGG